MPPLHCPARSCPSASRTCAKIREGGLLLRGQDGPGDRPDRVGQVLLPQPPAPLRQEPAGRHASRSCSRATGRCSTGLAAETRWDWSQRHPVIRISFADGVLQQPRRAGRSASTSSLRRQRASPGRAVPSPHDDDRPAFAELIRQVHAQPRRAGGGAGRRVRQAHSRQPHRSAPGPREMRDGPARPVFGAQGRRRAPEVRLPDRGVASSARSACSPG